jgi:tetratricopeptide (TPR) repeat protein
MLGLLLARLLLVFSFASAVCPATPEKPQKWLEVRSPHFAVITNGNEKQARRVIGQFERIREVFHTALPRLKVDTSAPIIVMAAKDEKTFEALGPTAWKERGQMKRSGFFLRGAEKNFVLLRLDVQGTELYRTVFHEYTHLLVNQNVKSLPLWLDEGLAEFYGNTRILDKEVQLGYPSGDHVQFLRENRLMPMATLFKVDHSSPYYNEEHKGSVFYAQSWAFVHYLMVVRTKQSDNPLLTFLNLLEQDVDGWEAAGRAFGDLAKVQKELDSYIHQAAYHFLRVKTAVSEEDVSLPARELTPAESAAVRGDFLAHHQEYARARALLEDALRQDPANALAHESLGFIELHQEHLAEAKKWFSEAVKLDSRSYLAHYYHAMLTEREGQDEQHLAESEASLRRATELNNQFAPAYGALASVLGRHGKDLKAALAIARRAIQLEPGVQGYHLVAASLLMQMGNVGEARQIAERLVNTAKSPQDRANAEMLLANIGQYQRYQEEQKKAEERARAETEEFKRQLEDARKRVTERAQEEQPPQPGTPAGQPAPATKGKPGWSTGKIVAVSCKAAPALELTLQGTLSKLRLHAGNYFKVELVMTTWKLPEGFNPCQHLQGHVAAISYRTFEGSAYDGEIVSVEVRK